MLGSFLVSGRDFCMEAQSVDMESERYPFNDSSQNQNPNHEDITRMIPSYQ